MPVAKIVYVSTTKKSVLVQITKTSGDVQCIDSGFVMLVTPGSKNVGEEINIPNSYSIDNRPTKDGRLMPWLKF